MDDYVKVTRAGDSNLTLGQLIHIERFLEVVRVILQNGGEMPIAVLQ